jgi:hypothetical protein
VRSLLDFFMAKVMKASWMGKEKDCRRRRVTSAWQIMRCLLCALASVVAMYDIPLDGRTEFADLCVLSSTQYHMRSCELSGSVQQHRTWSCRRIQYVSGEAMIIVKAVFFFFLTMMEHVGTIEAYIKTILILKKGLHLLVRVPLTWKGQPI